HLPPPRLRLEKRQRAAAPRARLVVERHQERLSFIVAQLAVNQSVEDAGLITPECLHDTHCSTPTRSKAARCCRNRRRARCRRLSMAFSVVPRCGAIFSYLQLCVYFSTSFPPPRRGMPPTARRTRSCRSSANSHSSGSGVRISAELGCMRSA